MKKKLKKHEGKKRKFLKSISKLKIKISAKEKKVSKIDTKIAGIEKKIAAKKAVVIPIIVIKFNIIGEYS